MMDVSTLVHQYGYWLVGAVAFIEGEAVVMAAGYAAHMGWLNGPAVYAVSAFSALTSNLVFFSLGRRLGHGLKARFPTLAGWWLPRVEAWLRRCSHFAIIGVRFAFWLRIPGLILLGDAGVPVLRFLALSVLGSALWAGAFTSLGWIYGAALSALSRDMNIAQSGMVAIALVAVGFWLAHRRLGRGRRA